MVLWVEAIHVVVDHHRLGRALLTNQKHSQTLLGNGLDQELCSDVVYVGHQNGRVLRLMVCGVGVGHHALIPVRPFSCGRGTGENVTQDWLESFLVSFLHPFVILATQLTKARRCMHLYKAEFSTEQIQNMK